MFNNYKMFLILHFSQRMFHTAITVFHWTTQDYLTSSRRTVPETSNISAKWTVSIPFKILSQYNNGWQCPNTYAFWRRKVSPIYFKILFCLNKCTSLWEGVSNSKKKREDLSLMAVKLDPRVLKQLHTVLCVHILREIELEVELQKKFEFHIFPLCIISG